MVKLTRPILLLYTFAPKGGKRSPPFLLATWGSGGRRFKSVHPDHGRENRTHLIPYGEQKWK